MSAKHIYETSLEDFHAVSCKDQILELIETKPKHFSVLLNKNKKHTHLRKWIMKNSLIDEDSRFLDHVRSAIYQESNLCKHGNAMKVSRINEPLEMCGGAKSDCKCYREKLSQSVKLAKEKVTEKEQTSINLKRNATMLKKYGVEYNSQRPEIKEKLSSPKIAQSVYEKLNDVEWLHEEYVINQRTSVDIASEIKCDYSTVLEYCRKHGFSIRRRSSYSMTEKQMLEFIESTGVTAIHSCWDVLENKELDIYVPSHKLAFEINGLYWHSFHPDFHEIENRYRHLSKTIECQEKNVDLVHFTDWEWEHKQNIVKSIIRSKLGQNKRLAARKTHVRKMDPRDARNFFEANHLQGHVNASHYVGLEHDDKIVMAASFGPDRFGSNNEKMELYRLSSAPGITVVGGASRLIKSMQTYDLVTYCDRDKSNGNLYEKIGFEFRKETQPGYFWTDGTVIISRYKAQKKQMKTWLPSFDGKLTEAENMFNAGYRRFWNCGNLMFEMKRRE